MPDMGDMLVAQLLYLESAGPEDITMYVNSPGGSVTAGGCTSLLDCTGSSLSPSSSKCRLAGPKHTVFPLCRDGNL